MVDPNSGTDDTLDILIEKDKIVEIRASLDIKNAEVIDASGLVVAPGFIDMHVHLREPGQEKKETIESGSRAAARGGFTSICAMPNTVPPNDHRQITEYIISQAAKRSIVNVFPISALTKGLQGIELTDMAEQVAAGAVAFSDDGRCIQTSSVMRRALEHSKSLNKLLIDHCEDFSLSQNGVMHEGPVCERLKMPGIPASAEEIMVARDIILAEKAEARLHIAHLSTKGSVQLVGEAKTRGVKVTAEATPHHLLLTDASLEHCETNYKVSPPLRGSLDVKALIEAVQDGTIDTIATDHAPHTVDDKNVEFYKAPFGMIGLETAVSLLLDRLVHKNVIPLVRFIEMISTRPAELLGLAGKGKIAVGADADLTLLDLNKEIMVDINTFFSKSRNCPFHGWDLKGAPAMTIVAGRVVHPYSS